MSTILILAGMAIIVFVVPWLIAKYTGKGGRNWGG